MSKAITVHHTDQGGQRTTEQSTQALPSRLPRIDLAGEYGVSTQAADNAPAIQAAINENPGAPLLLPGANAAYLSGPLFLPTETTIEGSNPSGMWVGPTRASMLKLINGVDAPLLESDDAQFVILRDLQFRGNKANQTAPAPLVNIPDRATTAEVHWLFDNVVLWEAKGDGLYVGEKNRGIVFSNSYAMECGGNGLTVNGSDSQIYHSFIGDNDGDGIAIAGWTTMVQSCNIWANRVGINAAFCWLAWLQDNFIDSNRQQGFFAQEIRGLGVTGNQFIGNSSSGDGLYPHLQLEPTMPQDPYVGGNSFLPNKDGTTTPLASYDILCGTGVTFTDGGNSRGVSSKSGYCNLATAPVSLIRGVLRHAGMRAGFFGATPTAKPTGVAVSAEGVHAALVSLGLIGA